MRVDVVLAADLITFASSIAVSKALFPYHSWQLYVAAVPVILFLWASLHWLLMRFLSFSHVNPAKDSATRYRILGSVILGITLLFLIIRLYSGSDI